MNLSVSGSGDGFSGEGNGSRAWIPPFRQLVLDIKRILLVQERASLPQNVEKTRILKETPPTNDGFSDGFVGSMSIRGGVGVESAFFCSPLCSPSRCARLSPGATQL